MEGIYVFLLRWDIPIFFIATISLIVGVVRIAQARYVLQRAMFTLERDFARETRSSGLSLLIISVIAIAILWYVNQIVAPSLPPELLAIPTATPDPLETPFASPSPLPPTAEAIQQINRQTPDFVATATLDPIITGATATPTQIGGDVLRPSDGTAEPFIPEGGGCTPGIHINSPRPETIQTGTIDFIGTATHPSFAFYGLEVAGPGTGNEWINILGGGVFEQVENDVLGVVDLSRLESGLYDVRLTVFGGGATPEGRCQIEIFVNVEDGNQ